MYRLAYAATIALLLCLPSRADTITFVDDIEMNVDVLRVDEKNVEMRVKYGTVTVLRSRVKKIEIDYEERRKSLSGTNETGMELFRLGQLCEQFDMLKEAADAYRAAITKPNLPADVLLKIGEFFEKQKLLGEARQSYEKLLEIDKDNEEIAKKVASMPKVQPMKPTEPVKPVEPDEPQEPDKPKEPDKPVEPVEPAAQEVKDGIEGTQQWRIQTWANRGNCEVVTQKEKDGAENRMLAVDFGAGNHDKTVVGAFVNKDLKPYKAMVLDIYNDSAKDVKVSFAVITMPTQYIESKAVTIPAKKWRRDIAFDLDAEEYKSEATNWVNKGRLENRERTQQFFFLIYNAAKEGTVYIDSVSFKSADGQ